MARPSIFTNPLRSRVDLQQLVCDLADPLLPHFSPGRANVKLGANQAWYGEPSGLLEGFSRPLWGLAPLSAGGGSSAFAHWDLWRAGLDAGTDPGHPEFWGWPGDFDQRIVEMAAFGFTLALAPDDFFKPLSSSVRNRVVNWLIRINQVRPVDNNWLFFRVMVNLGLSRCGEVFSQEQVTRDLTRLDEFYLGGGWYADGPPGATHKDGRVGDYYVPMAFHFYSLIWAQLDGSRDPSRAEAYRERARKFAQDFVYWFSSDGAALPFGRSLTYRFAQGAFWGGLAYAGVEALPWGVMKGLYLRHLRWWLKQPIFSETGLLTIGYAYPNLLMAESYNSPGSPYWALKAFLPLALADEHPFWSAEETPLPRRPTLRTVVGAKLVLISAGTEQEVVALNPGQSTLDWPRHAAAKYSKFAYSTRFGFSVPVGSPILAEGGFDNTLALSEDGRHFRTRDFCLDPRVHDGIAYSRWKPWPDVELETWLIASNNAHVRVHYLRTSRALFSAEGGFATGYVRRETLQGALIEGLGYAVQTPHGCSALLDLSGGRSAETIELGANSHLLFSLSAMPVLRGEHAVGESWLVCVADGGADLASMEQSTWTAEIKNMGDKNCTVSRENRPWWTSHGEDKTGKRFPSENPELVLGK